MSHEFPVTKICKSCHIDKPLEAFSPLKGGKYGRHPKCRACRNKENRQRRHNEIVFIYLLVDPFSKRPCYVGRSTNPSLRLRDHIAEAKCSPHMNPRKARWLLGLLSRNEKPEIQILEEITPDCAAERETYWIQYFRVLNPTLLNVSLPTPNY